jgi:hypothetical protein
MALQNNPIRNHCPNKENRPVRLIASATDDIQESTMATKSTKAFLPLLQRDNEQCHCHKRCRSVARKGGVMTDFMHFPEMAAQCAPEVHQTTLATLIQHESSGNPFAIGVNGNYVLPRQPKTKAEAIKRATWLHAHGYNFDAGLAQINIRNATHMGLSIPQLFDPCENMRAAAKILTTCYVRAAARYSNEQKAVRAALSCYNTGNLSSGLSNGYVKKVIRQVPEMQGDTADLLEQVRLPHSQMIVPNVIRDTPQQRMKKKETILIKKNAGNKTRTLASEAP